MSDEILSNFSKFYFHFININVALEHRLWSKQYGKENRLLIRSFLIKKFWKKFIQWRPKSLLTESLCNLVDVFLRENLVSDEILSRFSKFYFHLITINVGLEHSPWSKKSGKENRLFIRSFLIKKLWKRLIQWPPNFLLTETLYNLL